MKKLLIALAVLGSFAGAAFAQSATLYGKLDVGYGIGNGGAFEGNKGNDSKFQQWGNQRTTSRWGLKGTEDLGNGLQAYFRLESRISPEDGATGSNLFDRAAYVGLSGSFGSVQAGRQNTVINNVLSQFDLSGSPNNTSALGNAGISAISQRVNGTTYARVDSALAYISPDFSGFNFQAAIITKNDDAWSLGTSAKNIYTLGGSYNIGGFTIGAAYESKPADGTSASWGIGAKYDFGSFLISGGYFDNHVSTDGKGFYLGASAPFSAFTVGAQVAYNTDLPGDLDGLAWELFGTYDLSKRSQLYLQYGGINSDAEQWLGASRKYSIGFGLIHQF